jgi:hypothetical protein
MIINMNNRTVSPQRRVPPISQPRLIPGSKNKIEFHYGQTQRPLGRVGPAVQTLQPGQGIPPRAGSSFLSYPVHVSQQQIPLSSLGLRKVVEGPTVQWPSTRKSFLGAVIKAIIFRLQRESSLDRVYLLILTLWQKGSDCTNNRPQCTAQSAKNHTRHRTPAPCRSTSSTTANWTRSKTSRSCNNRN